MLRNLLFLNLLVSGFAVLYNDEPWTFETIQAILSEGYHAEDHYVTTSDGYILQMHRIPYKRYETSSDVPNRPVVFLMHGLSASSDSYIILGAEYAVAYNLADAGFDVWMGNARGNIHSRYHHTLDPDHEEQKYDFFDFTWEEIGMRDLPAMIDYVLEYTGRDNLHYIGHSQGGTAFFVLNTMLPEYNAKIETAHLLAGVGYMEYFPNEELINLAGMVDFIYNTALSMGIVELYPPNSTEVIDENSRVSDYCTGNLNNKHMCQLFGVPEVLGQRNDLVDSITSLFAVSGTAGAALKQIAHYGQNIRDKAFRRWSFSMIGNLLTYGSMTPPRYNLGLITVKTTMHYTVSDNLLDERDVLNMAADMPNVEVRKVSRESFLHEDFVAATDAKELVTNYIINAIENSHLEEEELNEIDDGIDAVEEVVDVIDGEENEVIIDDTATTDGIPIPATDNATSGTINCIVITLSIVYSLSAYF